MNISGLLVKECDVFETPRAASLPALSKFLELGFVVLLEFSNTQAILLWDFRLQNKLEFLGNNFFCIECVCVVQQVIANDF